MIYNPLFYPMIFPNFPQGNDKPPTLYSIMNSMVNFEAETQTKIKDLASTSRSQIFNFEYPLTTNVSRETFEIMILNKFMMRRIGFETFTAFQIQLNVKLNEIMPMYNKLFDAIEGWNLFQDGENINRVVKDNRTINQTTDSTNDTTTNLTNNSTTNDIEDLRHSDTPQNQLENVKNGSYVTDYSYNTRTGSDNSTSEGTSSATNTTTNDTIDNNNINETISRTPSDKINLYKQFIESKQNIYSMIFKDLDSLFYQLV